jgi:acetyl-CoA carboxylase biotin carboxyl carrier protein
MKKNSISEFELEKQDFKIKLKRGTNGPSRSSVAEETFVVANAAPQTALPASTASAPAITPPATTAAVPTTPELDIKSPMIGTFYRAPSPESANYVEIGTEVNPDTVVCIIEAMKVMNEIKAEAKGVVTAVSVENAKPVEFGQPLFKLRPI